MGISTFNIMNDLCGGNRKEIKDEGELNILEYESIVAIFRKYGVNDCFGK